MPKAALGAGGDVAAAVASDEDVAPAPGGNGGAANSPVIKRCAYPTSPPGNSSASASGITASFKLGPGMSSPSAMAAALKCLEAARESTEGEKLTKLLRAVMLAGGARTQVCH